MVRSSDYISEVENHGVHSLMSGLRHPQLPILRKLDYYGILRALRHVFHLCGLSKSTKKPIMMKSFVAEVAGLFKGGYMW